MIDDTNRKCNCMCNMNSMNTMPAMTANASMYSDNDCRPSREEISALHLQCFQGIILNV